MSDQAKITLSGKLMNIFPGEVYGNFEKRVVWLQETTDQYPQTYAIEFTHGNCNQLDRYQPGDEVEISINLRGRHWEKNGKEGVMNTLQGWRIILKTPAPKAESQPTRVPLPPAGQEPIYQQVAPSNDDLPF